MWAGAFPLITSEISRMSFGFGILFAGTEISYSLSWQTFVLPSLSSHFIRSKDGKIIYSNVSSFLESNSFFFPYQHAFCKNVLSWTHALVTNHLQYCFVHNMLSNTFRHIGCSSGFCACTSPFPYLH